MNRTFRLRFPVALLLCCLALSSPLHAEPADCPPLPNQVQVRVEARVTFDAASHLYSYAYTVSSDSSSIQEVNHFSLDVAKPVTGLQGPPGWTRGGLMHRRSIVTWGAIAVAAPRRLRNDTSLPASIVQIKPGDTLGGFTFQSPHPPGPVKYYVTGFVQPPLMVGSGDGGGDEGDAEMRAERLIERCPSLQVHEIEISATGQTLGPVDAVPFMNGRPQDPGSRH